MISRADAPRPSPHGISAAVSDSSAVAKGASEDPAQMAAPPPPNDVTRDKARSSLNSCQASSLSRETLVGSTYLQRWPPLRFSALHSVSSAVKAYTVLGVGLLGLKGEAPK
ncbi:hypothetical protein ISCGN_003363 [Ixodes scapularis]